MPLVLFIITTLVAERCLFVSAEEVRNLCDSKGSFCNERALNVIILVSNYFLSFATTVCTYIYLSSCLSRHLLHWSCWWCVPQLEASSGRNAPSSSCPRLGEKRGYTRFRCVHFSENPVCLASVRPSFAFELKIERGTGQSGRPVRGRGRTLGCLLVTWWGFDAASTGDPHRRVRLGFLRATSQQSDSFKLRAFRRQFACSARVR